MMSEDLLSLHEPHLPIQYGTPHHASPGPDAMVRHDMGQISMNTPAPSHHPANAFVSDGNSGADALVPIRLPVTAAPAMAGLGRIESSTGRIEASPGSRNRRKVIHVPTYSVNGGMDEKFDPEARNVKRGLHSLLTREEYKDVIETLNGKMKPSRAKSLDVALLAAGPLMVPLAVWGARHQSQVKRRKKLLKEGIDDFNERYLERNIEMHWNRHVSNSNFLTIEEIEGDGNNL